MNIKESMKVAEVLMSARVPYLFVGHSGVGKTAVVRDLAKEVFPNHEFVTIMASQQDVGDFVGLPDIRDNEDGERVTSWARPEWMPKGPCVIFLDELNNCRTDVESAMLQLVYEKRIHKHELHPDSYICAAINPPTSEYTTANTMSNALVKRFFVIPFEPESKELISWGERTGRIHPQFVNFMKHDPMVTGVEKPLDTTIKMEPCSRLWEYLSQVAYVIEKRNGEEGLSKDLELIKDVIRCSVGPEIAGKFLSWLETQEKPITYADIVADSGAAVKKFKRLHKTMKNDIISTSMENLLSGMSEILEETVPLLDCPVSILEHESPDTATKNKALKVLNDNVKNNISTVQPKLDAVAAFMRVLPNDLFYQVSFAALTKSPVKTNIPHKDQICRFNAYQLVNLYLFGEPGLIEGRTSLFDKVEECTREAAKVDKKNNKAASR